MQQKQIFESIKNKLNHTSLYNDSKHTVVEVYLCVPGSLGTLLSTGFHSCLSYSDEVFSQC